MSKVKAWGKVLAAVLSYLYKYRPYMTAWVICFLGAGIYASIRERDAQALAACMIFMMVPFVIRWILIGIGRIGGERNAYDDQFFRVAPKGRFVDYMNQYMEK